MTMTTQQQLFRLWKWLEENHEDVSEAYLLTYYAEYGDISTFTHCVEYGEDWIV